MSATLMFLTALVVVALLVGVASKKPSFGPFLYYGSWFVAFCLSVGFVVVWMIGTLASSVHLNIPHYPWMNDLWKYVLGALIVYALYRFIKRYRAKQNRNNSSTKTPKENKETSKKNFSLGKYFWWVVAILVMVAVWVLAYRHDAAAYNTGTSFQPTWEETLLPGNGEEIEVTIPAGYRHSSAECNPGTTMHIMGPNVPERPIQQEDGTVVDFTKPFDCSRKNHLYEAWFYDAKVTFASKNPDIVKNWYVPASK